MKRQSPLSSALANNLQWGKEKERQDGEKKKETFLHTVGARSEKREEEQEGEGKNLTGLTRPLAAAALRWL